jgi:membrane-associated phospholipid phosphatase
MDGKIIDRIGYNGPLIVMAIGAIQLVSQLKYFVGFFVSLFFSHYINIILKNSIREPRPQNIKPLDGNYSNEQVYGMPSYHSQMTFFAITFLYLVQNNIPILIGELFIGALTIYQAYKYHRHTLKQLFVGAGVGIALGYLSVMIIKEYLKGKNIAL